MYAVLHPIPVRCRARQAASMARKRAEYMEMVPQWYDVPDGERTEEELAALHQVQVCAELRGRCIEGRGTEWRGWQHCAN